jgi:ribosomal protein S18 acetylase RimI-like enzyme
VEAEDGGWAVKELRGEHDRATFSCGHDSLDQYIRRFASQNERLGVSRTFVALEHGSQRVAGYYSLAAGSVSFEKLNDAQRKRLPRYPVPTAHLGRLAVDGNSKGQGLGQFLLLDALERVAMADRHIAVHAVEVVAIDANAAGFYQKFGFTPLVNDPYHLMLSMATVRRLLPA